MVPEPSHGIWLRRPLPPALAGQGTGDESRNAARNPFRGNRRRVAPIDSTREGKREIWSGLRESNPSSWLGKPEHYHYAKPAFVKADCTTASPKESGVRR